ncbi:MAG: O-antigen ligase family protein [Sphingomonadales bacterium]|nr:O-antigen ligase family protein [Sphingomonadales bacterium]
MGLFLALCVVLTGSRTGIILLAIPGAAALLYTAATGRRKLSLRQIAFVVPALALAGAVLAIVAQQSAAVAKCFGRFQLTDNQRMERIWPDAWYAAQTLWPFGSGIGTFTPAFEQSEQLSVVAPGYANRAHFDYLEWMIEAGLPGALLLVGGLLLIAWHVIVKLRRGPDPMMIFGIGTILVIVLHSFVDYPLRNITLAVVFATSLAFLSQESLFNACRICGTVSADLFGHGGAQRMPKHARWQQCIWRCRL